MVVHDQDADAHSVGTSTTIVVPFAEDSSSSLPPTRASSLAHADEANAVAGAVALREPAPVVLDHDGDLTGPRVQEHADVPARACLTTLVSASWTTR